MSEPVTDSEIRVLARELTARDHERLSPPPEVWAAIAEAAGVGDDEHGPLATVLRLPRRIPYAALAVAAAVLAIAGIAGLFLLRSGTGDDNLVAEVAITDSGLQVAAPEDGRAALIETEDGFAVDLEVPDLPEREGFYEAWLIDPAVDDMYSLGTVDGDGRLVVPSGVNPADHPVVDISVEPIDGDPTHSGRSVLRGTLAI